MQFSKTVRVAALLSLFCFGLAGQETLSTLRGTATDASGAVVPGVAITVQEVATNIVVRRVTTDNEGTMRFQV